MAKIRLAILEKDSCYLNRIENYLSTKYSDQFQIHSFTNMENVLPEIIKHRIQVMLACSDFEIDVNQLPNRCGFAYLVDSPDEELCRGQRTICKFQKADLIYRQILGIYSENAERLHGLRFGDNDSKVILFQSVSGGSGASSMAAACAVRLAKHKKALYLNLEQFGSSDVFFNAEGKGNMADIIDALIEGNSNLALTIKSCEKQAENGVYFFSPTEQPLDMTELNPDYIIKLISVLKEIHCYDYIIVDTDFSIDKEALSIYNQVHTVVWVSDGSKVSNSKLSRAYNAIEILEQTPSSSIFDDPVTNRMVLAYNKFNNMTSKQADGIDINCIGTVNCITYSQYSQLIKSISGLNIFDSIM